MPDFAEAEDASASSHRSASSPGAIAAPPLNGTRGTGASIQDYALHGFLGEGSTAHVYLATHTATGEQVAIKVIDKLFIRQAQMEHKVQREMILHASLQHDQIVCVKDTFDDPQNHYLVLEYCEGGSVASLVRAIREKSRDHHQQQEAASTYDGMEEATAKSIFQQVALGVSYLHAHGIIHRDLKLSNLLLTRSGAIKISDFGLATLISEDHGTVCGTPNFIAPEVLRAGDASCPSSYDETVDIWSLGCILYTLLIGRPPFEGAKVSDTLANVSNAGRQPLPIPRGLSATVGDLIKRMLNWDAKCRPTISQVLAHPWFKASVPTNMTEISDEDEDDQEGQGDEDFQRRRLPSAYQPGHSFRGPFARSRVRATKATGRGKMKGGIAARPRRPAAKLAASTRPWGYESDESSAVSGNDAFDSDSSFDLQCLDLSSLSDDDDDEDGGDNVDSAASGESHGGDRLVDATRLEAALTGGPAFELTAMATQAQLASLELDHSSATRPTEASSSRHTETHNHHHQEYATGRPPEPRDLHFLRLRVEVTDLPFLGVAADATRDILWDCWESSDIRQLTRFTFKIGHGDWQLEYIPSSELLHGTRPDGSPLNHRCVSATNSLQNNDDDDLVRLVRLCHCLTARSLQLRRAAMAIDVDTLPIVHYDTLPDSLLESLRRDSVRATLTRQLTTVQPRDASPDRVGCATSNTGSGASTSTMRCVLPGVGLGEFEETGQLVIQFFNGVTLQMNARGSTIGYRRAPDEPEDTFDLASTPFLPTEVKKHFEHVPAFVRQLKLP